MEYGFALMVVWAAAGVCVLVAWMIRPEIRK